MFVASPNIRDVLGNTGVLYQTRGFAVHDTPRLLKPQSRGLVVPFVMYVEVSNQVAS